VVKELRISSGSLKSSGGEAGVASHPYQRIGLSSIHMPYTAWYTLMLVGFPVWVTTLLLPVNLVLLLAWDPTSAKRIEQGVLIPVSE
jgi:hypothetical protein